MLASLNHPHIAAIYGLGEVGQRRALVLELVEGETLAERIARGPIPVDEALTIARQIADALEAAHEKGIVHRDLKPANVKVTPDGKVKVLDFGLAKALDRATRRRRIVTHSPTLTAAATQAGVILGTAAYMSPGAGARQGRSTSAPTSGRSASCCTRCSPGSRRSRARRSRTRSRRCCAPTSTGRASRRSTPPRVRELLRRCLDRDPKHRLRDIGDARIALEDLASSSSGVAAPAEIAAAHGAASGRGPGSPR